MIHWPVGWGDGHDALFAQGLDNPLWVAHMPHPTDYDYDGPPHANYPAINWN